MFYHFPLQLMAYGPHGSPGSHVTSRVAVVRCNVIAHAQVHILAGNIVTAQQTTLTTVTHMSVRVNT